MRVLDSAWWAVAAGMLAAAGAGIARGAEGEVVPYVALDREFSEPILEDFAKESGIVVRSKYDVESTKTVGLTNRLIAEARRPVADLFWNNEILNTLRLREAGLLVPFEPPNADQIPAAFKGKDKTWYGFAARARILIVNTKLVPEADRPTSILDLADPKWKGKAALAKPLFGTTASHAACLFHAWGEEKARDYFRKLRANEVGILSGNKQVALEVAAGRFAFGMTDTDDAMVMIEQGAPVAIVYPDQGEDGIGTLFIPNTLCVIKGGPNPAQAKELAGALLSPAVEARLAAGPSAQIPIMEGTKAPARVETPKTVKAMEVDFEASAELWDRVAKFIAEEFAR